MNYASAAAKLEINEAVVPIGLNLDSSTKAGQTRINLEMKEML